MYRYMYVNLSHSFTQHFSPLCSHSPLLPILAFVRSSVIVIVVRRW